MSLRILLTTLIATQLFVSCGSGEDAGNDQPDPDPKLSITLDVKTDDAIGDNVELRYALFDPNGVVINAQNGDGLSKITNIKLSAKSYKLNVPYTEQSKPATIVMVAYRTSATANADINEQITSISQPLVNASKGIAIGDYFYGKIAVPKDSKQGEVTLSRRSGAIKVELSGDKVLVAQVKEVNLEFDGTLFYNTLSAQGEASNTVQSTIIIDALKGSYLLPTTPESGNSGKGVIKYGDNKTKEFVWTSDDKLRVEANNLTTIKLALSNSSLQELNVNISADNGMIDGNNSDINNSGVQRGYYTYHVEKEMSFGDLIPGAIAVSGNKLFVCNLNGKTVDGKPAAPSNPVLYAIEVFDITTGNHLITIPSTWEINGKVEKMDGKPRSLAVSGNKLYVAYSLKEVNCARVAVFNTENYQFIACIGSGIPYSLQKFDTNIDEPNAIYADDKYVYISDLSRLVKVYNVSDITPENHSKMTPKMSSVIEEGKGKKPHLMSFFRSPENQLYLTSFAKCTLNALVASRLESGIDVVDIIDPSKTIDLNEQLYYDFNVTGNFNTKYISSVAYHHNNMFLAVNTDDDEGIGTIVEYTSEGKPVAGLGTIVGRSTTPYTFSKPMSMIVVGDQMIVSDQNNKQIVLVAIKHHTTNEYE